MNFENYLRLPNLVVDQNALLNVIKDYEFDSPFINLPAQSVLKCNKILGIQFSEILFFKTEPGEECAIHMDCRVQDRDYGHDYVINIPLNDAKLMMRWYDCERELPFAEYKNLENYVPDAPNNVIENCQLIASSYMDVPHLVKVSSWHNIKNFSDDITSCIISVRFERSIKLEEIKKILKHKRAINELDN